MGNTEMQESLLTWIRCPECKGALDLMVTERLGDEVKEGSLRCGCGCRYPIVEFIPRFVGSDQYVGSFSYEWQRHAVTQLDSRSREARSERAFRNRVNFPLEELKGRLILDAGCGMGRYAEVVAGYGGTVIGVDLSYAVQSAHRNLKRYPNAHVIQADLFNLPFNGEIFDFIYSFGVLHHTPDPPRAFRNVMSHAKRGGQASIFVYTSYNKLVVYSNAFWRSITTRLPTRLLYYLCHVSVPLYYLYRLPGMGSLGRVLFEISMERDWRWRVLDTFDWYSPKFQFKYTHWEVFKWFKDAGIPEVSIHPEQISLSGTKR